MIVGIGIDVVAVDRFERVLDRHPERMMEHVFTRSERADCDARSDRILALAARFAAKEACMKALGTGWGGGVGFGQVEVLRQEDGAPVLRLSGRAADRAAEIGARTFYVSLTHQPTVAAAVVILQG